MPTPSTSEQLETLKNNLAVLESQRVTYGMNPPLSLLNEIEFAQREIARLQHQADDEELSDVEHAFRPIGNAPNPLRELFSLVWRHEGRLTKLERTDSGRTLVARWLSLFLALAVYTALVIKELRDAMLVNPAAAAIIVALVIMLVILLRVLAALLENADDDRHD